jgi:hypothetical protein
VTPERVFQVLREQGLLDTVLGVVRLHAQEAELTLRGTLLEGELLEADGKTRAELYRLQGAAGALARLMTVMKTLARPPTPDPDGA